MENETVLITGASTGIGYELAKCFAAQGENLVLVSRNAQQLEDLAADCRRNTHGSVICIVKDLSEPNAASEIYQAIHAEGLDINILVNNAGYGIWGKFMDNDLEKELKLVRLQINFILEITKLCLPSMKKNHYGKILNVGSVYSYTPVPKQSVYSSCKAFLRFYTLALREEVKGEGIQVSLLCPGITLTQFRPRGGIEEKKSLLSMSAKQVAYTAIMGLQKNKAVIIPGFFNKVYVGISKFIPTSLVDWLIYRVRGLKIPKENKS